MPIMILWDGEVVGKIRAGREGQRTKKRVTPKKVTSVYFETAARGRSRRPFRQWKGEGKRCQDVLITIP